MFLFHVLDSATSAKSSLFVFIFGLAFLILPWDVVVDKVCFLLLSTVVVVDIRLCLTVLSSMCLQDHLQICFGSNIPCNCICRYPPVLKPYKLSFREFQSPDRLPGWCRVFFFCLDTHWRMHQSSLWRYSLLFVAILLVIVCERRQGRRRQDIIGHSHRPTPPFIPHRDNGMNERRLVEIQIGRNAVRIEFHPNKNYCFHLQSNQLSVNWSLIIISPDYFHPTKK